MLVVILLALLAQRKSMSRAYDTGVSSWDVVKSFRPIPTELRGLAEVEFARYALWGLAVVTALGAPFIIKSSNMGLLTQLPIYGLIGVSLVVLTGWAGQISLGQFGLVGAGALAAGGLIANHNIDFFAAMAIGIVAGVGVAVIVGLPAVRIQGLYLAVTTLAFGYAMAYFLNKNYWVGRHLLPKGLAANINRPVLYGRIDLTKERNFYYVCVVFLALAVAAALAFRKNRSGRVLIAARDNQRAAPAYSINLTRTRLAAFAVSGGMAGAAGVLFAYSQHQVIQQAFGIDQSISVFLAAVIGGLTSVPWAVLGVIGLEWFTLFGPHFYGGLGQNVVAVMPLLLTGPLLIVNMYFYPGGSAENGFQNRDKFLRWVAARHNILVPSLVADRRVEEEEKALEAEVITEAERHVEQVESLDTIRCPMCGESMPLADAPAHEHLRPKETI
jgi:branched-chain amino acid transport system permease protein